jgi:hypothetical protein
VSAARALLGFCLGILIAGGSYFGALLFLGGGLAAAAAVSGVLAVLGAAYGTLALGRNVYAARFLSILGLSLDLTWSMLNTVAGLLVWLPLSAAKGSFVAPDDDIRRSGCLVYTENPRGGPYGATTIGTVIAGGWSSHEEVHVWQGRIFGPLYMVVYGLAWVLNVLFRLLTFRVENLSGEAYSRICFEDWAYWGGVVSGSEIRWGGWIGGFFLSLLYVGLLLMIAVGIALGVWYVWVAGLAGLAVYSLVRALAPPSH